uniref:Uncharacterized protein n=1 Tax=Cucumis melo TaxID=3656 RepID=A0A9I9CII4_CUCME
MKEENSTRKATAANIKEERRKAPYPINNAKNLQWKATKLKSQHSKAERPPMRLSNANSSQQNDLAAENQT